MNTILHQPISRVKRACTIVWLNWQINDLNTELEEYQKALNSLDGRRHPSYITGLMKEAIKRQRALCDRRDALRGQA